MAQGGKAAATETRLVSVAEIDSWFRSAPVGALLVYCSGERPPPGPTVDRVRELSAARLVQQNYRAPGDYLIVKLPPPPAARGPVVAPDEATETIFEALERCAERGRPAYSDRDLAKIAGLATRHQAAWRFKKLVAAGRIAVETSTGPDHCPWRVVTIVTSGRRTAASPAAARRALVQ